MKINLQTNFSRKRSSLRGLLGLKAPDFKFDETTRHGCPPRLRIELADKTIVYFETKTKEEISAWATMIGAIESVVVQAESFEGGLPSPQALVDRRKFDWQVTQI